MRNVVLYSLPLMLAGSLLCSSARAVNMPVADKSNMVANVATKKFLKKTGALERTAPRVKIYGFNHSVPKIAKVENDKPYAQMQGSVSDFMSDEDGNVWYYTQNDTYTSQSIGSSISQSVINIYNNNHELAGTINVDIPEGMSVNMVSPYGTLTKKFFNLDNDYELLVELHQTGNADNNYMGTYITRVYKLDGTLQKEYNGAGVFLNIVKNSWTKYQRFILSDAKYEAVEGKTYDDGSPYMSTFDYIDVYKPASWGGDPSVEHSFKVDEDYTYYGNDGVPFSVYNIKGEPYYVISQYSKIFDSGDYDSETGFFIPTKDNSVLIKSYDGKFNLVDDIEIPMEKAADTDYRMAQIGNFENLSVTKDYFTNDGNLAYVLTYYDMTTKVDDYRYKFVAYDHTGKKIADICDGVYLTWFKLNDIAGAEDQMAFMQYVDDDETKAQVKIVNLPSLTESKTMPSYIDGQLISTVFNRYGGKDNYKYLMKMGQGVDDGNGNVLARVAWLNQDMTIDHYTSFNLGPKAENFALTLSDTYVNPYLFNSNDKLEFFFQAKVKENGSSKLDNVYMIGDEDGNIITTFKNGDKGTIMSAGCYSANDSGNEMYVAYQDETSGTYNFDFYKLPLSKFDNGGDGTPASPYLVSSAGDLLYVSDEPTASYKMVGNIDMSTYNSVNATWKPIRNFAGTFDGGNHCISNLNLNTAASSIGLFGDMGENASVKNLVITNPVVQLNDGNSTVGVLAADAVSGSIENVHVYDAQIKGDADATVGGIIGQAALNTTIKTVSLNSSSIDVPNASSVGGVAGDIRTSAVVTAAAVNDATIKAQGNVGGIVGSALQSEISNSHANGELTADNTIGGIVGNDNETKVDKCIFDGTVTAENPSWNGLAAAGIVGYMAPDWSGSTTAIITNNIASGKIQKGENAELDATAHRIVGYTIANEYYEEGETPKTEQRLSNNWAINTMTVAGTVVSSTDENGVEGYDAAEGDINSESLAQIGYAFGSDAASPWKDSGKNMPVLFFENELQALTVSQNAVTLKVGETFKSLYASAYGKTSDDMTVVSSNDDVVKVVETESDGKTMTVTVEAVAEGTADLTFSLDDMTVACTVTVCGTSAISQPVQTVANGLLIMPGNGSISANGAVRMSVYSLDGNAVANVNGSSVSTSQMGSGMYIVVATDADGNRSTAKVIVR